MSQAVPGAAHDSATVVAVSGHLQSAEPRSPVGSRFPNLSFKRDRASRPKVKPVEDHEMSCDAYCPVCGERCTGMHGEVPEHHWCPLDHEWNTD